MRPELEELGRIIPSITRPQLLFVHSLKKSTGGWVFPKGHPDREWTLHGAHIDLTPKLMEAAKRETEHLIESGRALQQELPSQFKGRIKS
jgi:hypothetical protein